MRLGLLFSGDYGGAGMRVGLEYLDGVFQPR